MKSKVRIIKMPPGFPPEEIRQHWVGIEIPLADPEIPFGEANALYYNPLSLEEVPEHVGYEVNAYHALQELYKQHPEFEEWFASQGLNAGPETVGKAFGQWSFAANCCELIDGCQLNNLHVKGVYLPFLLYIFIIFSLRLK